jgi:prepilin-type N-terminal cleavage/methylation domain-containing protein
MIIKQKTKKGFTLIELLLVIAIIAILSTIILIQLDSGRERAEVNRYVAYATQMHRLVADSVAAGKFDSAKGGITKNSSFCLGDLGYVCSESDDIAQLTDSGTGESTKVYKALTYLSKMPKTTEENAISPYSTTECVYMTYKPQGAEKFIRITMAVGTDEPNYVAQLCKRIGWETSTSQKDCYKDIKLHSRL